MNLFNAISNWQSDRQEKHLSKMKDAERCPDCGGRGYTNVFDYEFGTAIDCKGCNGSGSYSAWAENNEIE